MSNKKFTTTSGIEIKEVYNTASAPLEGPGEFPYTRGIQKDMYRGRLWTMRQYAGFSTAEESNKRYHYLLKQGTMGLSVAFDLPTQIGYDSDHEMSEGEVGKVGVAIDSLKDMEILFDGIELQKITTSMTINATASILLAMYIALAKKQGADIKQISGTIQNDILKEYAARGTYIYPPKPSMRIITDIFEYCSREVPKWNTISISGYHIREAGSTAVQELAFTLANGKAYLNAALEKGLDINIFAKRLSFFFNCHNNFFEEIAKFRAARRMWAKITKQLGATDEKAQMLRFHTQTGGSTLTAQQPLNNVIRVTNQAMAAVLGGTQSLHTNGYDEALSLPTEAAAKIALRTQQVIAFESGVTDTVDPLAGSYFVEALTNDIEAAAQLYIDKIDAMGGSVNAIENGYIQNEIADAAYQYQVEVEQASRVIVGVNKFTQDKEAIDDVFTIDESIRTIQTEKLQKLRTERDNVAVEQALNNLMQAARGTDNLMPFILAAVEEYASLGEIANVLRNVFGEY
ncbi:acyl-CoA mutase large subunit family protein [Pedobacter heparinus]|uniref:Methylmalonyl-CoA mutase, large subunit n=1 Tax=Pedobacter heparinus (strain ATCC 13125 / DSM 2366 / CIP 104194 / JCM 7457 / NBRC 12017 / NCIMB 9290 / NRRL B-14731 / HIM 762-3) TaxID=485917 RepID=C6XTM0_PEDHD|nr:methylmalonyl-CoA mutase family protein [Pedobacter heparinus]ACU05798.1 methylmalonyl-CoA mutase, large subunit [Pedobacter heparinus DSM 2366]